MVAYYLREFTIQKCEGTKNHQHFKLLALQRNDHEGCLDFNYITDAKLMRIYLGISIKL